MPLELPTSRRQASSSAAAASSSAGTYQTLLAGELLQPEIGARLEPQHLHVLLDHAR